MANLLSLTICALALNYASSIGIAFLRPKGNCPVDQGYNENGFELTEQYPCEDWEEEVQDGDNSLCCAYPCNGPEFHSEYGRKSTDGECEEYEALVNLEESGVDICCLTTPICPTSLGFLEEGFFPGDQGEAGCGKFALEVEGHCCKPLCTDSRYKSGSAKNIGAESCSPGHELVMHEGAGRNICCQVDYRCPEDGFRRTGSAPKKDGGCYGLAQLIGESCCQPRCPIGHEKHPLAMRNGECRQGIPMPIPENSEGAQMCCKKMNLQWTED